MTGLSRFIQNLLTPRQKSLRWFFALREHPASFETHSQLVRAAVHSAQTYTSLLPHFLYDGEENRLTEWLSRRGVPIIRCQTRLMEALSRFEDSAAQEIARGTFLRLEIPRIMREQRWPDRYALYTDCDVLFLGEVVPELLALRPEVFAVAPQTKKTDYEKMNAGVMLMNIPGLSRDEEAFIQYCRDNMEAISKNAWDQGAYREFYAGRWDRLPLEFNWKPYWGDASQARIVHFHGPKPFQADLADSERATELVQRLASGDYQKLSARWREELAASD